MLHDLDDIITVGGIAKLVGMSPPAVSNWRHRYPDFPKPLIDTPSPLFSREEFIAWYVETRLPPELVAAIKERR